MKELLSVKVTGSQGADFWQLSSQKWLQESFCQNLLSCLTSIHMV